MDYKDMKEIFDLEKIDFVSKNRWFISVEDFLEKVGFDDVDPTKEAMLEHNGDGDEEKDIKGYKHFIESGDFPDGD